MTFPNTLSDAEAACVAALACMSADDPAFRNLCYEAGRAGALATCRTLGDYARAILRYKLADLERLEAERIRLEG
jgi:hypothetical protein